MNLGPNRLHTIAAILQIFLRSLWFSQFASWQVFCCCKMVQICCWRLKHCNTLLASFTSCSGFLLTAKALFKYSEQFIVLPSVGQSMWQIQLITCTVYSCYSSPNRSENISWTSQFIWLNYLYVLNWKWYKDLQWIFFAVSFKIVLTFLAVILPAKRQCLQNSCSLMIMLCA